MWYSCTQYSQYKTQIKLLRSVDSAHCTVDSKSGVFQDWELEWFESSIFSTVCSSHDTINDYRNRLCNCDIREHKIYSTWPTQTKLLRYVDSVDILTVLYLDQDRLFLQNDTINDYRRHHLTCRIIYSEHDRLIVSPSWKIGAVREDHEPWTMRIHFCLQNFSGWWSRKTKSNAFKKLLKNS